MPRPVHKRPQGIPTRGKTASNRLRQWFIASAEGLARRGYKIDLRRNRLSRGHLIWYLNS